MYFIDESKNLWKPCENRRPGFVNTGIKVIYAYRNMCDDVIISENGDLISRGVFVDRYCKNTRAIWMGTICNKEYAVNDDDDLHELIDGGISRNIGIKVASISYNLFNATIIDQDGYVWIIGHNALEPTKRLNVFTNTGIIAISASCGHKHIAIVNPDGHLLIGDGGKLTDTGLKATSVSCGDGFTAYINEYLYVSGSNSDGQLGLGHTNNVPDFTNTGIKAISVSCYSFSSFYSENEQTMWNIHTENCIVITDDEGYFWRSGSNYGNKLGFGDVDKVSKFVRIEEFTSRMMRSVKSAKK